MRLGRITAGIIAAAVGAAAAVVVGMVTDDLDHAVSTRLKAATFLGVAFALLWLADRYGIMEDAYTRPVVDLYARDEKEPPPPPTTPTT
jgi:hypothetical protein